jgi:protein-tyrosine phosphatase
MIHPERLNLNIPIPDRSVPADKKGFLLTVERLAELVKQGRYVGVHCRAGIGRSSLLVASVLIRVGWDAESAFAAIESARGCTVPDTTEQKHWVTSNVPSIR